MAIPLLDWMRTTMSSGDLLKTLAPFTAVLAASITGCVAIGQWWANGRRQERDRKQETFAAAFEACIEYAEMPYAIRRRRIDVAAEERVRLSEQVRAIQIKLTRYEAWVRFESPEVGEAYQTLVRRTREVAGAAMKDAWLSTGADSDRAMVIPSSIVDLRPLSAPREEYMAAAEGYLRRRYSNRLRRSIAAIRMPRRPVPTYGSTPLPTLPPPTSAEASETSGRTS
ncbi:hypothetical protein [Streptacidiphilus carbonis]|uniref:hypothetical protein n=1 Tax=Streptacidiphilus carbonis TaxID=105422 RepID=UPI0005A6AA2E|nr:hypothetical protein [Streptacidiphilus carbonis]